MNKLVTSSHTTLRWLDKIKSKIEKRTTSLRYGESKYWASFNSFETNRNVVYLQPHKDSNKIIYKVRFIF